MKIWSFIIQYGSYLDSDNKRANIVGVNLELG
jgi:hypothetical protein